jgi:hypothetical protein
VLAILIEMKETSSTKADIHATLQEIKEELHKDMAKATETVCKLGEENQKWMQQQNEKINDKLAEAEILVEMLVNQKMEDRWCRNWQLKLLLRLSGMPNANWRISMPRL